MSLLTAIAIVVLVPVAYLVIVSVAYWLGGLPRRSEFEELRREVSKLREELATYKYRTAHSR